MKTKKCILSVFALIFTVAVYAQNWTSGLNSGGSTPQTSTDVTEASGSSTVVVGTYTRGTAVFGSKTLDWVSQAPTDPTNMTPNGFIVKYSAANSVLWATRIPAAGGVTISSVTADASGYIYVCGTYQYICEFYNASSPNAATPVTTLPSSTISPVSAERRGFIAKYTSSGLLLWARRGLGDSEVITDIAVSEDKTQLVVTGRVYAPGTGSGIATGSYVLWMDPATGNTVRTYNYSDSYNYTNVNKTGLCIDHSNNVIVSGRMEGTSYIVKGASGNITVSSSSGGWSTIYAKYNSSGVLSWARATKTTISSPRTSPSSLAVDENNDIYIAGWVGSETSNFDLQFPASSTTYTNVPVPTSTANSGYIVKLNSANGYALWKSYARNTTSGNEAISLTNGKCNFVYACINTTANPTYTDASNTVISPAISSQGLAVVPINTSGQLLTTTPWIINGVNARAHIASSGKSTLQCVSTASSPVSLQTSGGPLTLSPSSGSSDVILGTITYAGPAPTVTLPGQTEFCEGTTIQLDATATGTPTFTYTWSIFDITSNSYVPIGTSSSPSYSVSPLVYHSYIMTLWGVIRYVGFQVTVTDCSGLSSSSTQTFVIKEPISYSQVSGVDVCYKNQITAPNAVFSLNAVNVDAYYWRYSSNGGSDWNECTGPGYSGVNTATLTVISPTAMQNNYLFRCKLGGCPTQETNAALLTVTPCPQRPAGDLEKTLPDAQKTLTDIKLSLYPNPTNTTLEVVFEDGASPDTESVISEAYILDMMGRKVRDIPFGRGHHTLEVSDLQNGTYSFVVLTNGKVMDQQKFIVMH